MYFWLFRLLWLSLLQLFTFAAIAQSRHRKYVNNGSDCVLLLFAKHIVGWIWPIGHNLPTPQPSLGQIPMSPIPTSLFIMIIVPTLTLAVQHLHLVSVISGSYCFHFYQRTWFPKSISASEPQMSLKCLFCGNVN